MCRYTEENSNEIAKRVLADLGHSEWYQPVVQPTVISADTIRVPRFGAGAATNGITFNYSFLKQYGIRKKPESLLLSEKLGLELSPILHFERVDIKVHFAKVTIKVADSDPCVIWFERRPGSEFSAYWLLMEKPPAETGDPIPNPTILDKK